MATITITVPYEVKVEDDGAGNTDVNVYNSETNVLAGTIVRAHAASSGTKIAGDMPGLDPNIFVVDAAGHLANG